MTRRNKQKPKIVTSLSSIEANFKRELDVFRTEVWEAAQYLYAYLAIHATVASDKSVHCLLNTAPLFWNTNLRALQGMIFITLGRVFDQSSQHNIDRMLKVAQDDLAIFSKEALARRKQGVDAEPPSYIAEFLDVVYEPTSSDFKQLRKCVGEYRKTYNKKYRGLRHKVFAHKELSDPDDISNLFSEIQISELRGFIIFLMSLHEGLWQLYMNGIWAELDLLDQKPLIFNGGGEGVHDRITREVESFLSSASRGRDFRTP